MKSKNKKAKLISVSLLALCFSMLAFGVYALKNATLAVQGTIGFTAHDCMVRVSATIEGDAVVNGEPDEDGTPSIERTFFAEQTLGTTSQNQTKLLNTTTSNPRIPEIYFSDLTEDGTPATILITFTITNDSFYPVTATINNVMDNDSAVTATIETQSVVLQKSGEQDDDATLTVAYNLGTTEVNNVEDYVDFSDFAYTINLRFTKYVAPAVNPDPEPQEPQEQEETLDLSNLPQTRSALVELLENAGYTVNDNLSMYITNPMDTSDPLVFGAALIATKDNDWYFFDITDYATDTEGEIRSKMYSGGLIYNTTGVDFGSGASSELYGHDRNVYWFYVELPSEEPEDPTPQDPEPQEPQEPEGPQEVESLNNVSNVTYNESTDVLTFDSVDNATSYEYAYLDYNTWEVVGNAYETTSGSAISNKPTTAGMYLVSVRAKNNVGAEPVYSDWTNAGVIYVTTGLSNYTLLDIPLQSNLSDVNDVNTWVNANLPGAVLKWFEEQTDELGHTYQLINYVYYGQGIVQDINLQLYSSVENAQAIREYIRTEFGGMQYIMTKVQNNFAYEVIGWDNSVVLAQNNSLNTWLKSGNIEATDLYDFANYWFKQQYENVYLDTAKSECNYYIDDYGTEIVTDCKLIVIEATQIAEAEIFYYNETSDATSAYNAYVSEYNGTSTEVIRVSDNIVALYTEELITAKNTAYVNNALS